MDFLKKFFLILTAGGSATGIGTYATAWSPFPDLNYGIIRKTLEGTESFREVSINENLDPFVKESSNPFIYSLFSTNLASFVKSFHDYFYNWALFKWAEGFLTETELQAYTEAKIKAFNELVKNKHSYSDWEPENKDPSNWTRENHVISASKKVLEEVFDSVLFKELYVKGTDKDEIGDDGTSSKFGNGNYVQKIAEFQKFLFDEWFSHEAPDVICTKRWEYSSTYGDNNYKSDFTKPEKPNFAFPDFKDKSAEIKAFVSGLSSSNGCTNSELKIVTDSDLEKLEDPYELAAIFYRKHDTEEKKTKNENILNAVEASEIKDKEPIEYFIIEEDKIKGEESQKKLVGWKVNKEIANTSGKLNGVESKRVVVSRDVKVNTDKYGTLTRTNSGLAYFFKDHKKAEDLKKDLVKNRSSEVLTRIKEYFKANAGEILGRYLKDKDDGGVFLKKSWDTSISNLSQYTSEFSYELRNNKRKWKIFSTLSTGIKDYGLQKWKNKDYPNKESGLAAPVQLVRNLDKSSEILEASWVDDFESKENKEKFSKNDGSFPIVGTIDRKKLSESAKSIKEWVSKYLKSLIVKTYYLDNEKTTYFMNDYILDSVYHDFRKNSELMRATVKNIHLINRLNFDFFKNDIDTFSKDTIGELKELVSDTNKDALIKMVKENIAEVFYASSYLKEPIESRLNYGGYKYQVNDKEDKKSKFCVRKIKTDDAAAAGNPANGDCTKSRENTEQRVKKLRNYWLTKNYVFNEYGYEISSKESSDYLRFLYSFRWFFEDKFKNFREFGSSHIPVNRFGALVWLDRVDNVTDGEKLGANGDKKLGGSTKNGNETSVELMQIYFRDSKEDSIFNPFFSRNIGIPKEDNKDLPLSSNSITAFAKTGSKEFTEFSGFHGFVSEYFNDKSLPKYLQEALFKNFRKSNPSDNKNYTENAANTENLDISWGSAYGSVYSSKPVNLEELIDSFQTTVALRRFLYQHLSKEDAGLSSWFSERSNRDSLEQAVSLKELKDKTKDLLKSNQGDKRFKKATTRFSGFLQNPDALNSIYGSQKFFIQEGTSTNTGHVMYVTQVNKYDFEDGFSEFVKDVGIRTIFRIISAMSQIDIAKASSEVYYLLKNKFVS